MATVDQQSPPDPLALLHAMDKKLRTTSEQTDRPTAEWMAAVGGRTNRETDHRRHCGIAGNFIDRDISQPQDPAKERRRTMMDYVASSCFRAETITRS